ncbi:MAG: DUF362 domain-containing protein, partial [Candidatus Bathyarchaeota archaeon]
MKKADGRVYLIKTKNRTAGTKALLNKLDLENYHGKQVALKANFNSADPFPASTHIDTLRVLVEMIEKASAKDTILAERSGMGNTREVLEKAGVFDLSNKHELKVVALEEVDKNGWTKIDRKGTHWLRGFYISKIFLEADKVIQTCCLKTHRFGGHFTMSLKNSVGLVAKRIPGGLYDYMLELHGSPYQRLMIAEINKFYNVDLVVMDAMKAFVNQGPDKGEIVSPDLLLASRDRIAIDAVGIALLRIYGSTKNVMKGRIFELDQIR